MFDYANPPHAIASERARSFHLKLTELAAAAGEPFRGHFDSAVLHARAHELGFVEIEDLGAASLAARYLPDAVAPGSEMAGHVVRMATA